MARRLKAGIFYGEATKSAHAGGFRFTESSYEPRLNLPAHSHELAHFCFVVNGSYQERLGSQIVERTPSTLIFYPPDTIHSESSHTGGRHFLIEIEPARAAELRDLRLFRSEPVSLKGPGHTLATRLISEFHESDELSALALEGLALELVVNAARKPIDHASGDRPIWLDQAIDLLNAKFVKPPTLDQLAKCVDIHPVHLTRVFHRFEGCTISDYVRRLRVNHARRKLAESTDSAVEIALACGFGDQSHFSRSFKRITGMTPTEFRRMSRR